MIAAEVVSMLSECLAVLREMITEVYRLLDQHTSDTETTRAIRAELERMEEIISKYE